jgi:hypothetical protein
MQSSKAFDKNVHDLRIALMTAASLASTAIPDTLMVGSEFDKLGPQTFQNHWLKGVAEWLSESLEAFNAIQQSMGMPKEETRFLCISTGQCDRCSGEIRQRNEARLASMGQKLVVPAEVSAVKRKGRRPSSPKRPA